eukprot:3941107-Pleurochrysis_carterae.AAC.2
MGRDTFNNFNFVQIITIAAAAAQTQQAKIACSNGDHRKHKHFSIWTVYDSITLGDALSMT